MKKFTLFILSSTAATILSSTAATFLAACGTPADNTVANYANTNTTKPVGAAQTGAPTIDALMALDKQANEAYVKGDSKFFEEKLSDKFVILGGSQRMDKAATVKMIAGVKCDIKSMDLTEPALSMIDADTYALSYKAKWDGTCDGPDGKPMKVPDPVRSATIWVRSGDKWQAVFHGENLIVDPTNLPKAAPVAPPKKEDPKNDSNTAANTASPTRATPDANTDALVKVELALWQAWKEHDAKKLDALMAKEVSFVNIFGTALATRTDALKDWTGNGCQIKSVSVTDGFATALSPTVQMLTRKGTADGTCSGHEVGGTDIWGVSIYVKDGDAWKFAFGMNLSTM